jgi:hypothetical protein
MNDNESTTPNQEPSPPEGSPASLPRRRAMNRKARAVALSALLVGGAGGAAIIGPLVASAASPTASASASPSTSGGANHSHTGHVEAVTDTSVVAKAIGITEAALLTELNAGKTPAQVATEHGAAVQTVINALVADGLSELAAQVKAGTLTQAQADAMKAEVTQRATDQVNNGFGRGRPH